MFSAGRSIRVGQNRRKLIDSCLGSSAGDPRVSRSKRSRSPWHARSSQRADRAQRHLPFTQLSVVHSPTRRPAACSWWGRSRGPTFSRMSSRQVGDGSQSRVFGVTTFSFPMIRAGGARLRAGQLCPWGRQVAGGGLRESGSGGLSLPAAVSAAVAILARATESAEPTEKTANDQFDTS